MLGLVGHDGFDVLAGVGEDEIVAARVVVEEGGLIASQWSRSSSRGQQTHHIVDLALVHDPAVARSRMPLYILLGEDLYAFLRGEQ